ncbi:MFS transporter [Streptomyces xanthophaeus]|uniref:MFS transporter n=1 Tax=Streptomyces xanthophaeus TaxID=67385 RepID=UPI00398FB411
MTSKPPASRGFRRVWAASCAGSLGDGLHLSALPLLALGLTRDPLLLSLVTAAALLPWLLLGPAGAALADRWDHRRTLWTAQAARAALLLAAVACAAAGWIGVPLLIGLAFLLAAGRVLFDAAFSARLPELLGRDPRLTRWARVRLRGTEDLTHGLAGPPAGAALFTLGRTVPLAAEALALLFSSLMFRSLPPGPPRARARGRARAPRGPLFGEARAGAAYLLRDPLLLGLALRPALGNLALTAGTAVFVLLAHEELGLGPVGFGVLLAVEALGGLLGSLVSAWVGERIGTGGTLALTAAVLTLAQLGLGLCGHPAVAGAALALRGAAIGAAMVPAASLRQSVVPTGLSGPVTAASRLLALAAAPLGAVLGGWLAGAAGLRAPYLAGAVLLALVTAISLTMTTNAKAGAALTKAAAGEPRQRSMSRCAAR